MNSYDIKCKYIEEELRFVWPEWHVARRLGGGSFGDVFQIYRDDYGIRVDSALKVIQVDDWMATVVLASCNPDGRYPDIPEALRSEIQIMEALRGAPNIVIIEDFAYRRIGQTSTLFVRMELLKSLQEVLPGRNGQGTLASIGEITKLGKDICRALIYCEKKGIIHRDIKPANLFVDRFGDYKVGDFGASKRMETVHMAQTMTGIGTISYMAPEIFRGQSYNNTVDIYALGLVLYQLLNNGRMPFLPESGTYTTQDIDSANYQRLHGIPVLSLAGTYVGGEQINRSLDAAVRRACAVESANRYQTAKDFFDALVLAEMPEKKTESEYVRRDQSEPLRGWQQERGCSESEDRSSTTSWRDAMLPVRSSTSHSQKKGFLNRYKKFVVAVTLWCMIALLGGLPAGMLRRGVSASADADQGVITETEGNDSATEVYRHPGPISDSWKEIITAGEDGSYIGKYKIGDTKELDLGEEGVIEMELVAFDVDELADGSGNAHMTWIAKNLLNSCHVMNEKDTSKRDWPSSDMRIWLQNSILPLFPDTMRSKIKEVKKYSYSSSNREAISSSEIIWIPSGSEVFGRGYGGYEEAGPEYLTAFSNDALRIKQRGGFPSWWWLRSASIYGDDYFDYFKSVSDEGSAYDFSNGYAVIGVAIGFCL